VLLKEHSINQNDANKSVDRIIDDLRITIEFYKSFISYQNIIRRYTKIKLNEGAKIIDFRRFSKIKYEKSTF